MITFDIGAAEPPADLVVRIDEAGLFNRIGASIVSLGDMDGDDKPDFASGAPMADVSAGDLSGKVYVFMGKDISASTTLLNSMVLNSMVKNQGYGTSLAYRSGQLLIGAPGAPRSNADTGGVSMIDPATGEAVSGGSSGGSTGGKAEYEEATPRVDYSSGKDFASYAGSTVTTVASGATVTYAKTGIKDLTLPYQTDPDSSPVLSKTRPQTDGAISHAGGVFWTEDDADYTAIRQWISERAHNN